MHYRIKTNSVTCDN